MKYPFISDPGHGWLMVEREELINVGVAHLISSCSYQHKGYVYLEEDCDAPIFLNVKKERGEHVEFHEVHQENTPIRNYSSFKVG